MATEKETPEYIVEENDGVTITLAREETVNGGKVQTLHMREPIVGDGITASKLRGNEAEREVSAFANLCEVTPDELKAFSLRNFGRLQEAFSLFTS